MKVLWFTNTPSLAEKKIQNKPLGGGWIKSLEKEIIKLKKVDLAIAFYSNTINADPTKEGTKYYPISSNIKESKINNFFRRMNAPLEPTTDLNKFLKIINDFKPDIIHILGTEGPFGLIQNKITDIPIVISIQGNNTVYSEKYYAGISKEAIRKYTLLKSKLLFKSYIQIFKKFYKVALREQDILKQSKFIIGRTDWDRRITRILAPLSKYYHNDEILRDTFYNKSKIFDKNDKVILFTTTGTNVFKGIETILKTADLLDSLNIKFTWNVAGVSASDPIVEMMLKSFNLKLSNNLKFLGKLDENELVSALLDTSIYIMASHIENSPNNLCEAMILGLPCIATDAGGTSSLLKNKKEGLIIQDGDAYSMAGSILELINDLELAKKYGNNAKTVATKRHEPAKIVNELLEIYELIHKEFKK